jgi:hypothetical protein
MLLSAIISYLLSCTDAPAGIKMHWRDLVLRNWFQCDETTRIRNFHDIYHELERF